MKRVMRFLFVLFPITFQCVSAQESLPHSHFISIQPTIWLDNLVPSQVLGASIQYEKAVSAATALAARIMWFRDPLFGRGVFGSEGIAFAGEFRFYVAGSNAGWHLGPFAELAMYQAIGSDRSAVGSATNRAFDFGALLGHSWVVNRLSFDLSVRTAWYSPEVYPSGKFFPSGETQFNSHLLISLGYAID
jgi:hypothetical protein